MSYHVLARKWRPRQLAELVGQTHIVRSLTNALKSGRIGHAFLLSGARGVGKTTIGRLLAKGLNCELGVTPYPCDQCSACRAVGENRFVDLIEVDAASRTKVDDIRGLLDNVVYTPTLGRYKVYLIDEVHMLSNHSFNALLKTLEEPPEHVKFIFATTDPVRIPATILSRCLQFNLKPIPTEQIHERMASIVEAEGITSDSEGLELLAHAANGSMRDGLSLLDQAINFGAGQISAPPVREMLGTANRDQVLALFESIANHSGSAALEQLQEITSNGLDADAVLEALLGLLHRVAVLQIVPTHGQERTRSLLPEEQRRLEDLANHTSPEEVQLLYQLGIQGRRDLMEAPEPHVGLEMAILRMVAFTPFEEATVAELPSASEDGPSFTISGEGKGHSNSEGHLRSFNPIRSNGELEKSSGANSQQTPVEAPQTGGDPCESSVEWYKALQQLELTPAWRAVLDCCTVREFSPQAVCLAFPASQQPNANSQRFREQLKRALEAYFGSPPELTIEERPVDPTHEAPQDSHGWTTQSAQSYAEEAIARDPKIQVLRNQFGAEVKSVRPDDEGNP